MNTIWKVVSTIVSESIFTSSIRHSERISYITQRFKSSLQRMHRLNVLAETNPPVKKKKQPLLGKPLAKGIVLKTLIKHPRKPNSANRKCVLVRLSIKKDMVAYVPGEGHNLQEHQSVLCEVKKLKDTPGVKIRCIRGAYDLPHVKK